MKYVLTADEDAQLRIEASGASASLHLRDDRAQLLYLSVPKELRGQGTGRGLLDAAEAEAAARGASFMCADYGENLDEFSGFLSACGYEMESRHRVLSINPEELLASAGVTKSLRMQFKDIRTEPFQELFVYQWEEIIYFLQKYHYDIQIEDLYEYDPLLSWVAYDTQYHPCAVLLSSLREEGLAVDLLFGFSKTKPQYILSVCQGFARALRERFQGETSQRLYVYSCADFVTTLIRRLLDRKYEIKTEYAVMKAKKKLTAVGERPERDIDSDVDIRDWKEEVKGLAGQRNINDKAIWQAHRR